MACYPQGCTISGTLDSQHLPTLSRTGTPGPSTADETQQLFEQLRQRNAQIALLQRKLLHFRRWISSVQAKVQVMNPQALKNSRKLYVGNIPAETGEVRGAAQGAHGLNGATRRPAECAEMFGQRASLARCAHRMS